MPYMHNLKLIKPLAVLDLETTGTDVRNDRIVEISILKIQPSGEKIQKTRRVNPTISIPHSASLVHGITDEDVKDQPTFHSLANNISRFLDNCDLCGYNLKRFDLKMLCCEFARAQCVFSLEGRAIIDPMEIFHHYEPRDLNAALYHYCGRQLEKHHSSQFDVLATADILDSMLKYHFDLPKDIQELHKKFENGQLDVMRMFQKDEEGNIRFDFGKHKGKTLDEVYDLEKDYFDWMLLKGGFLEDVNRIVKDYLQNKRK